MSRNNGIKKGTHPPRKTLECEGLLNDLVVDEENELSEEDKRYIEEKAPQNLLKLEFYYKAQAVIDEAVAVFREELENTAIQIAKKTQEKDVVTSSHVEAALRQIWSSKKKYGYSDVLINLGTLLLGYSLPQVLFFADTSMIAIFSLALGVGLFCIGAVLKTIS